MTPSGFRRLALSMPDANEQTHMAHPDFRVGGKIFATLGYPDDDHGMVVLPLEEQEMLVKSNPNAFTPAKGVWGRRGSTCVRLDAIDAATLKRAIEAAWRSKATTRGKRATD